MSQPRRSRSPVPLTLYVTYHVNGKQERFQRASTPDPLRASRRRESGWLAEERGLVGPLARALGTHHWHSFGQRSMVIPPPLVGSEACRLPNANPLAPTDEWQQLHLHLDWPEQITYELIRPVVVYGRSVVQRAKVSST